METWNAPLSIFAPLILGVPDETNGPKVDKLLGTAASLVPKTTTPYAVKRRGSFTKSRQVWTRQVGYYVGNAARPHVMRVRLLDVPPDKTIQEVGIGSAMWEVTLDLLPAGSANPAIPDQRSRGSAWRSATRSPEAPVRFGDSGALPGPGRRRWTAGLV